MVQERVSLVIHLVHGLELLDCQGREEKRREGRREEGREGERYIVREEGGKAGGKGRGKEQ